MKPSSRLERSDRDRDDAVAVEDTDDQDAVAGRQPLVLVLWHFRQIDADGDTIVRGPHHGPAGDPGHAARESKTRTPRRHMSWNRKREHDRYGYSSEQPAKQAGSHRQSTLTAPLARASFRCSAKARTILRAAPI